MPESLNSTPFRVVSSWESSLSTLKWPSGDDDDEEDGRWGKTAAADGKQPLKLEKWGLRANLMLARRTEGGREREREAGRPVLLAPHSKHMRRLFWVVSLPPPYPPPQPHTHSHPHNLLPSVPSCCHSASLYLQLPISSNGWCHRRLFPHAGLMSGFNTMCQAGSGDASSGAVDPQTQRKASSAVICIDISQKSVDLKR